MHSPPRRPGRVALPALSGAKRVVFGALLGALLGSGLSVHPATAQSGGRLPDALSTHGLPGLVNTPAASALPTGVFRFNVNSMPDYQLLGGDVRDDFAWQANVQLAIGLWGDRLTIGGRATEIRRKTAGGPRLIAFPGGRFAFVATDFVIRDLAANASLLLLREGRYTPALTLGVQDLGGAANFLEGRFAVASKRIGEWARVSAGWGIGEDVLDGAFGGIEVAPLPGLGLVAEYDTERFNAGARWRILPERLAARGVPQLTASAFWTEDEEVSWSVDLSMPLDPGTLRRPSPSRPAPSAPEIADPVARALVEVGYENVAVQREGSTLRIEYENRVYNQSELDGLGVALRTAAVAAPPDVETFELVVTSVNVPTVAVRASRSALDALAAAPDTTIDTDALSVQWAAGARAGGPRHAGAWRSLDLEVTPVLENVAFTESTVADVRLSVVPSLRAQLPGGLTLDAAARVAVYQSPRYFLFDGPRPDPQLERATLGWLHRWPLGSGWGGWAEWSGGRLDVDNLGVRQQTRLASPGGRVQMGLDVALVGPRTSEVDRLYAVGSLGAYLPEIGAQVTLFGGQFLDEDRGAGVDVSRFFGDTRVSLFARRTDAESVAGMQFAIPLSSRKDLRPLPLRPRVTSAFRPGVQTVVGGDRNPIRRDVGRLLSPETSLAFRHLDWGRLAPVWIQQRLADPRFWPGA
jgi:hypothetical protein